jgi:type I restriction enzyme S subunit
VSKWKMVKLGEVCTIQKGTKIKQIDYSTDAIRFIQIDDLRNDENIKYCKPNDKYVLVKPSDIIIAWDGANAGTVGFGLNGAIGSTLARICLDNDKLDTAYVGLLLRSKYTYLRNNCTGSTIPHINKKSLENIKIPLPPLETQKHIAKTLDTAAELIALRKKQLAELDNLTKSIFYDMFGDPVINEKGWDVIKLSELGDINRGVSKHRPRNAPELLGGVHPLIQTGDVANADFIINEYKQTYSDLGLKQSKKWSAGTLCITIAANIAKTAILGFDACFPDSIVGFMANELTNNIFIHFWFGFFQRILEAQAPESAQKNINLRILENLDVVLPPLELQNKFATIVTKIEEQKALVKKALDESQYLFDSLMSKFFE